MISAKILERPVAVSLVATALGFLGILLVFDLPIKLYPNTRQTRISVRIPHPGFTAEDFEKEYGETLTEAINTVDGAETVETTYNNGSSSIVLFFEWGLSGNAAKSRVALAMAQARASLPEESENYTVRHWAGRTAGFYAVAAYSPMLSSKEVFAALEPLIKPRLDKLKNVDIARITAIEETRVEIELKPDQVLKWDLSPDGVARAIRKGYRDISVGAFRQGRGIVSVRIRQDIDSIDEIKNIIVKPVGDHQLRLKDVADVRIHQGPPHHLYSVNGKKAVVIFAMPDEKGNIRELATRINEIIEDAKAEIPDNIHFRKLVDPGDYINNAIANVVKAGLIGGSLAILITFLFLGEIRNTVLIAISIPLSLVLSFVLMKSFDVTLNLISLGGLTLAVGMIVDSSIVVIENIYRHLSRQEAGKDLTKTVIGALLEVRTAIVASTLTSIVVFLPINFTSKLTAAILGDLAKTTIFVLVCSMTVALFVIPSLSKAIFARRPIRRSSAPEQEISGGFLNRVIDAYEKILRRLFHTRSAVAVVVMPFIVLIGLIAFVAPNIDREIMAKPDSARVSLRFTNTTTKDPEELLQAIAPLEKRILEKYDDALENLFARIYRANRGSFTLTLKSRDLRSAVIQRLQNDFPSAGVWRFEIRRWDPAELPLPRTHDLKIAFIGPDQKRIISLMEEAIAIIRKANLYANVTSEPTTDGSNYLFLKPRRPIINAIEGVSLESLSSAGRIALSGQRVIEITHEDEEMDIYISYPEKSFTSSVDVENLLVTTAHGGVPFKHFFDFDQTRGVSEILYLNGEKFFNVVGKMKVETPKWQRSSLEEKVADLLERQLVLPPGYGFSFADTQEEISSATASLLVALAASIGLIYVILGVQFNSLVGPLVIMVAVPLGLIGVITALFVAGSSISLNSLLGTILLGGIAVNNSILIFDFYRRLRGEFRERTDALIHACRLRLRPVLITTLTTILGMVPIALALGEGTNVIQPLGIAVAGGLGFSTLATVFVLPCLLYLLPERNV